MNHIDQFRQNEKKLSAILFQLLSLPFLALPYALCSMRLYLPRLKAGEHHAVAEMAAADSKKASCLTLISIAGL
jgi:hypothetical protein